MRRIVMAITICGFLFLTGCGEELPEDELVKEKTIFEDTQKTGDLEASNFPDLREGSGQTERHFYTMSELREEVKNLLGDNYWPEVNLSAPELKALTGITEDMYVDFLAERQTLDAHIDTMILIHAKEDYVGGIERALEEYRSAVIEQNKNYPQNLCKAQASRLETIDDYVCFVQLGADTTALADKGDKAVMAYCLEENEKALYVLEQAILQGAG